MKDSFLKNILNWKIELKKLFKLKRVKQTKLDILLRLFEKGKSIMASI